MKERTKTALSTTCGYVDYMEGGRVLILWEWLEATVLPVTSPFHGIIEHELRLWV